MMAERFGGKFMPSGYKGPIVRQGLGLYERPMALTLEARAEERSKANAQRRGQMEQLGITVPTGFSTDHPRARAVVNKGLERSDPSMRPALTIEE